MANLNPYGIDLTTGQYKPLGSGDSLTDNSGSPVASGGLPTGYMHGYRSETDPAATGAGALNDVWVHAGSCRSSDDAGDIVITSKTVASATTGHSAVDGLATLNGVDEKGLDNLTSGAITASQSGTTITATGSVIPHYNPTTLEGTISTSGTALTGSGTKFMAELAIGDLVGSDTTYGFSRITDIDSDTTATLAAALPGGSATSISGKVIHNATIWCGTNTIHKCRVTTINAAGTSIVCLASQTVGAGGALTIGVLPGSWEEDNDLDTTWVAIWVVTNGSTPGVLLSTQHVELLAPPSGYTYGRRIGWACWMGWEEQSPNFRPFRTDDGGSFKKSWWTRSQWANPQFGGGSATSWTTSGGHQVAPRTSNIIHGNVRLSNNSTTANTIASFKEKGAHEGAGAYPWMPPLVIYCGPTYNASYPMYSNCSIDMPVGWNQEYIYIMSAGTSSVRHMGYRDVMCVGDPTH